MVVHKCMETMKQITVNKWMRNLQLMKIEGKVRW